MHWRGVLRAEGVAARLDQLEAECARVREDPLSTPAWQQLVVDAGWAIAAGLTPEPGEALFHLWARTRAGRRSKGALDTAALRQAMGPHWPRYLITVATFVDQATVLSPHMTRLNVKLDKERPHFGRRAWLEIEHLRAWHAVVETVRWSERPHRALDEAPSEPPDNRPPCAPGTCATGRATRRASQPCARCSRGERAVARQRPPAGRPRTTLMRPSSPVLDGAFGAALEAYKEAAEQPGEPWARWAWTRSALRVTNELADSAEQAEDLAATRAELHRMRAALAWEHRVLIARCEEAKSSGGGLRAAAMARLAGLRAPARTHLLRRFVSALEARWAHPAWTLSLREAEHLYAWSPMSVDAVVGLVRCGSQHLPELVKRMDLATWSGAPELVQQLAVTHAHPGAWGSAALTLAATLDAGGVALSPRNIAAVERWARRAAAATDPDVPRLGGRSSIDWIKAPGQVAACAFAHGAAHDRVEWWLTEQPPRWAALQVARWATTAQLAPELQQRAQTLVDTLDG